MRNRIIVDTGPIVAFLHRRDRHHRWATVQFAQLPVPFLTCEAVITEAAYILDSGGLPPDTVFDLVRAGALAIDFNMQAETPMLQRLMRRYRDRPMDLADACVLRMTELHSESRVLTVDSDFHIYRKHGNKAVNVIMP